METHSKPTHLKAMAADKNNSAVSKTDLYKIDPRILKEEDGFNVRSYDNEDVENHIENLKQAMLDGAVIPPILVRSDGLGNVFIVDGHCRVRAAIRAIEQGADGLRLAAVNFRGNDADRIQAMLRSNDGLKFKPTEVAQGYLRLENMGFNIREIAAKAGKSEHHIRQYLQLATADHAVQKMVENGEVSAQVAIDSVTKYGDKATEKLEAAKVKAAEMGKTKVTNVVVKQWLPKRAVLVELVSTLKAMETVNGIMEISKEDVAKLQAIVQQIKQDEEKSLTRKSKKESKS